MKDGRLNDALSCFEEAQRLTRRNLAEAIAQCRKVLDTEC